MSNTNLCDLVGKYVKVDAHGAVFITNETGDETHPFDGAVAVQPTEEQVHEDGAGVFIKVGGITLTTEWYTTHADTGDDVFEITGKED